MKGTGRPVMKPNGEPGSRELGLLLLTLLFGAFLFAVLNIGKLL